jgi:hypothetical protein
MQAAMAAAYGSGQWHAPLDELFSLSGSVQVVLSPVGGLQGG